MEVAESQRAAAAGRPRDRSRSTSTASASRRARTSSAGTTSSSSRAQLDAGGASSASGAGLSLFLGVAGTYRQNDSVDVVYDGGREENRPNGVAYPRGGADRGRGARAMTTDDSRHTGAIAALELERRNFLILLVAGGARARGGDGARRHGRATARLVDAVQDVVPTWFAVCFGGQVVAYLGYVLAVRDIAPRRRRPAALVPPVDADGRRRVRRLRRHPRGRRLLGRLLDVPPLGAPPPRRRRARARARRARVRGARARGDDLRGRPPLRHRRPCPARDDLPLAGGRPRLPRRALGQLAEARRRASPTRATAAGSASGSRTSSPGSGSCAAC